MINQFLSVLNKTYKKILQENLVGIYLHGSLVFNCFNPEIRDIDFIVVVRDKLNQETQHQLIKTLLDLIDLAPKKGSEMSVVLEKDCLNVEYPTPYDLHFSNGWLTNYATNPSQVCNSEFKTDKDLVAHFTVIKNYGQVLSGKPINEVFGDVKREYFIDSLYEDIVDSKEAIVRQPMSSTLNLCRVLAYLKEEKLLSKEQGGLWALDHLNVEYQQLIGQVLDNYKNNVPIMASDTLKLAFAEDMLARIDGYFIG